MHAQPYCGRGDAPRDFPALSGWTPRFICLFFVLVALLYSIPSIASAQGIAGEEETVRPVPLLPAQAPALRLFAVPDAQAPAWQLALSPEPVAVPERPPLPVRADGSAFARGVVKDLALDPMTYGPAVLAYAAMRLDWDSSQPFFRNGYQELNQRFTVNGVSGGVPLSYAAGNRKIAMDALWVMGMSAINNGSERVFERFLLSRLPEHPKLVRVLGWAERTAFASWMAYTVSAPHFRQWQANQQLAAQLGLQ